MTAFGCEYFQMDELVWLVLQLDFSLKFSKEFIPTTVNTSGN